jgi:hypothetical protein
MRVPVRCLVVRTISPTCKRVKCAHCGKLHDMQVMPGPPEFGGRGWRSVPGSRACTDPNCPNSIQPTRKRTAVNRDWRDYRFERDRILGLPTDEYDLAADYAPEES